MPITTTGATRAEVLASRTITAMSCRTSVSIEVPLVGDVHALQVVCRTPSDENEPIHELGLTPDGLLELAAALNAAIDTAREHGII